MDPRINHHPEICNRINRLLFSGPTGEAKLAFFGHILMENRHGLVVSAKITQTTGKAE